MKLESMIGIFMLFPPILLAIKPANILEQALPDSGDHFAGARLPHFRTVQNVTGIDHIRFTLKAGHSSDVWLSEKPAESIMYSSDFDYIEMSIAGWDNTKSIVRVGTMEGKSVMEITIYVQHSTYKEC